MENNNDQFLIKTNRNINGNNEDKYILNIISQQKDLPLHINTFTSSLKSNSSRGRIKIVNNNNEENKTNISNNTLLLQEKLKNIFLEREKAQFKYKKHSIPEQLKYNSDEDESNISKDTNKNGN